MILSLLQIALLGLSYDTRFVCVGHCTRATNLCNMQENIFCKKMGLHSIAIGYGLLDDTIVRRIFC